MIPASMFSFDFSSAWLLLRSPPATPARALFRCFSERPDICSLILSWSTVCFRCSLEFLFDQSFLSPSPDCFLRARLNQIVFLISVRKQAVSHFSIFFFFFSPRSVNPMFSVPLLLGGFHFVREPPFGLRYLCPFTSLVPERSSTFPRKCIFRILVSR